MISAIIFIIAILALGFFAFNSWRTHAIAKNGIEADAVVTRIEEQTFTDIDDITTTSNIYFVSFRTAEGHTVEAELRKAPKNITEGARLRIKYLPENPKVAVPAGQ